MLRGLLTPLLALCEYSYYYDGIEKNPPSVGSSSHDASDWLGVVGRDSFIHALPVMVRVSGHASLYTSWPPTRSFDHRLVPLV